MAKLIGLIDCNNFYVSCERVFNPALKKRPVMVLSNNDGCVIARSNEVKKIGIKMGQPMHECTSLVVRHDIIVLSSNFALYGDMSARVMQVIADFAPQTEIYSVDEAFIAIPYDDEPRVRAYAQELRDRIYRWTGIPVSIGVAPSKTLAKIANKKAKQDVQGSGVCVMLVPDEQLLRQTPVEDIWGVGYRYARMLKKHMINNAFSLSVARDDWVRKNMTIAGLKMVWELRGISCIDIVDAQADKKSIACTRSFSVPITSQAQLGQAVARFATRAAEKLRSQNSLCGALMVFCSTGPFAKAYYSGSRTIELSALTSHTPTLISSAKQVLASIYQQGYHYKKAGVVLMDLIPADQHQQDIGTFVNNVTNAAQGLRQESASPLVGGLGAKEAAVDEVVDKLNARWGRSTLFYAAQGAAARGLAGKARKSPAYTTRWSDIPVIRIK